ncbi:MAG: hypothetical protein WA354_21035 [Terracidiphilus sp.]
MDDTAGIVAALDSDTAVAYDSDIAARRTPDFAGPAIADACTAGSAGAAQKNAVETKGADYFDAAQPGRKRSGREKA